MSLIKWESDVEVEYQDKDDEQQALMLMLMRNHNEIAQWTGKVEKAKSSQSLKTHTGQLRPKRIKVRKKIGGTDILIDIGPKEEMFHYRSDLPVEADISISANGKMNYTIDEITELNLVIKEAHGVYHKMFGKE